MNDDNGLDQKRLLLVVAISGVILLAWQTIFAPPVVVQPQQPQIADSGVAQTQREEFAKNPQPEIIAPPIKHKVLRSVVDKNRMTYEFTNDDGQLHAVVLDEAQYRVQATKDSAGNPVPEKPFRFVDQLTEQSNVGQFLPPVIELELAGRKIRGDYTQVSTDANATELKWEDPQSEVEVTRRYALSETPYTLDVTVTLENKGQSAVPYDLSILTRGAEHAGDSQSGFLSMFVPPLHRFESVCKRSSDFERSPLENIRRDLADPDDPTRFTDGIGWTGVENRYFMSAVIPNQNEGEGCEFFVGPDSAGLGAEKIPFGFDFVVARMDLKGGQIEAGQKETRTFKLFMGPKKLDILKSLTPQLDDAIDFGWFGIICVPMLWLLGMFHSLFTNWGFAIIGLTLVVKLITLPLTQKQYKSMASMRVVQPKMKELQEKYKNNQPKLQQEMMALYKEYNVNPLAGCLPMLIMMPIYFALYRSIYSAVELYQADFGFWIQDLSRQDPYYILPILLGLLMLAQMKFNPAATQGAQQKTMMYVMPIMMTLMMLFLPSGLVLYIIVNTLLGILQQFWLLKQTPATPVTVLPAKK